MSFNDITIVRRIPVINNYVQLPNNLEKDKSATTIAEVSIYSGVKLTGLNDQTGGARLAGSHYGSQEMISLPATAVDAIDLVYNQLRALV